MKNIFTTLLLSLSLIIFNFDLFAQTIQIGSGTAVNGVSSAAPINVYWKSRHTQFVYTKQEINAAGVGLASNIIAFGFYVTSPPNSVLPNFTIKMKLTTARDTSVYDTGPFTTVHTVASYMPTAGGYDMFTLQTPFMWDGSSNVLIDVCNDIIADAYSSTGQIRVYTVTSGLRHGYSDTSPQCGVATTATTTDKPQCQMVFLPSANAEITLVKFLNPVHNSIAVVSQAFIPQVEMKNNGLQDQSNFQVELHAFYPDTVTEIYSSTQSVGNITSGETQQLNFDEFTPNDTGRYFFRAFSTLETDEYRKNDTTRSYFYSRPLFSGEYAVGTGGDFSSLAAAISTVNNSPINGNITFNIISDLAETGTVQIGQWTEVGDGGYSLLIQPSGGSRTISRNAGNTGAIILNGADRVTIDGRINGEGNYLTIKNTNTSTVQTAILINSLGTGAGCNNITIRNCNLSTGKNDAIGTIVAFQAQGDDNDNLSVIENVITKCQTGISIFTSTSTGVNNNLLIQKNKIGSDISSEYVASYGINVSNTSATEPAVISGNEIFNLMPTLAVTPYAIQLGANTANTVITGNKITDIKNMSASYYYTYGINLSSSTASNDVEISNNIISGIVPTSYSSTYYAAGIRIVGGTGHRVYFNSVNLYGAQTVSGIATSAALYITSSTVTGTDIRNNIFSNSLTGLAGSKSYAVYVPTSTTFGTINYNDYYVSGTYGILGYYGADKTTLTAWQTSSTQDQNSFSSIPRFTSNADLHIPAGTKSVVNNAGEPINSVQFDYDGEPREGTPDLGADEFSGITPSAFDAGASSVDDPVEGRSKKALTSFVPKATITNEGTSIAANISVTMTIAQDGQSPFYTATSNVASLASFASTQVTFTAVNANNIVNGNYVATVTVTLASDGDASNNSRTSNFFVKDALAGSYNIGSGQTYTTLTQAINDAKDVGVSGAVTFNLLDAIYNEVAPITLTGVNGLSTANPLTLKAGLSTVVNIAGTASEPWAIRLRGVSGVTFDGSTTAKGNDRSLTVNVTGGNGKYGILLDSSSSPKTQYNVIKNIKVTTGASVALPGTNYLGIWLNGSNSKDTANQIVNCEVTNFGEAGIRADKQHSMIIKNNYVHDCIQATGALTVRGIWLRTGTTSAQVLSNTINNIINTVNANGTIGIANEVGVGSNLLCANNMISGIRSSGTGGSPNFTRGIYSNASNQNDSYFYNSINLNGSDASTSTTSRSACIEFGLTATNPKLLNNIFVNSMTSGENTATHSFGIYFVSVPTGLTTNYNDIYIPTGAVGYDGSIRATINDWIGTGRDVNSVSADPKFISNSDLHIQSDVRTITESWGNPTGITGIVDVDVDGNVRYGSAGYNGQSTLGADIGADEGDFQLEYWIDIASTAVNNPLDGSIKRINDIFSPVATFQNIGFKRLQNFPVSLVIKNSNNFILYNETVGGLDVAVGASQQVVFPPIDGSVLSDAGIYTAEATMSTDANASNNVFVSTFIVKGPLAGVYTVGAGGNYATLTNALEELSILGVNAATTYNLVDGSFNMASPIVFDSIKGASSTNTITIDGNGATLNISGNDATDSAAVRFRGASYITLQELSIAPLWNKARYGVWVKSTSTNHASHNTIQNCIITTGAIANQSQSGYFGVLLDSIVLWKDTNNRVINCDITKFGLVGISARKNAGAVIQGNTIHDWNIQSGGIGTDVRGIIANIGSTNSEVKGNTIKNIVASIAGIRVHGIENNVGAGSSLFCANNMVINVRSSGGGSSANTTRGIYSSNTNNSGDEYYFNTVILTGGNNSTSPSSISAGIEINVGGSTAFTLLNNNVYQTMTHGNVSAKAQCIKLTLMPQASSWNSNYNNFYFVNTGEASPVYLGTILATDHSSIASWRTSSGKDAASISADPRFVASDDGHVKSDRPESPLNGAGTSIAGITTDIDGDTRLSSPDIGADEVFVTNTISGKKYHDIDANIATVLDRSPLQDWKVYISQNGSVIDSQLTDNTGTYTFSGLASGTYIVQEEEQFGWTPLGVQLGSGADAASIVSTTSMQLDVNDGDDAVNFNFINAQPGIIAVRVYADADAKFYTENRSNTLWGIKLYRDSISSASIVDSVISDSVLNYTGAPGTYIAVEADSNKWVAVAHVYNGLVDSTFNVKKDTFTVAAGTQHDVHFINFQKHSITVRSLEDDDGSFYFSSTDRTSKKWNLSLKGIDSVVAFIDTMVSSDSLLVASFLPAGTYVVAEADTEQWTHLGIITSTRNVRTTQSADTIVLANGSDSILTFVNTLYKPDTTKYRTFSQLAYGTKAVKMKPKKVKNVGLVYPVPTGGNVRDAAFVKYNLGKGNPLYVGIPRVDSAKYFGWVMITKAKGAFDKLLSPAMTGASTYFTHIKALKDPAQKKLNNHLVGELLALKTSLIASDEDIISATKEESQNLWKLGDLIYLDIDTLSLYHNKTLRQIIAYADTFLTYGKSKEQNGDTVNFALLDTIITKVNRAFNDPSELDLTDTIAYTNLRIFATMKLADNADFLKRDVVVPPKSFAMGTHIVPETFALLQNYPNPFNPTTMIEFELPEDAMVSVSVYNVLGQRVRTLLNAERIAAGFGEIIFDASLLPSGVYFYHLDAKSIATGKMYSFSKKMMLMK